MNGRRWTAIAVPGCVFWASYLLLSPHRNAAQVAGWWLAGIAVVITAWTLTNRPRRGR